MEYSYIYLNFNKNFTLEQIPDECIINMLEYINYKLLYIYSSKAHIIVRNVNDNQIIKYNINDDHDNYENENIKNSDEITDIIK